MICREWRYVVSTEADLFDGAQNVIDCEHYVVLGTQKIVVM